jgi:hypothetical protein
MSLHMNIFWPKLILFICSTENVCDYFVSAQRDSKYTYLFPLMINVVFENIP